MGKYIYMKKTKVKTMCLQNDTNDEGNIRKDKHQNVNDAYLWWLDFIFSFSWFYIYFPNFYCNCFIRRKIYF